MNKPKSLVKLILNISLFLILITGFFITTYALKKNGMNINDNLFKTGRIKINLNDGQPIINEEEFLFEPGMTIMKDFFIENKGTFDVYYKVYFTDVLGDLANILKVTIKDENKVLYEGTISELSEKKVKVTDNILQTKEKVFLKAIFHYPKESGNNTQNSNISFRLGVDAVQTKNNPNKLFD